MKKCYWCNKKATNTGKFNFGEIQVCSEHIPYLVLVNHLQGKTDFKMTAKLPKDFGKGCIMSDSY